MKMENFFKESEEIEAIENKPIKITDNLVDKVIHLIKHRKKKTQDKHLEDIIDKLKEGGIV
jgi:hypothetical protein